MTIPAAAEGYGKYLKSFKSAAASESNKWPDPTLANAISASVFSNPESGVIVAGPSTGECHFSLSAFNPKSNKKSPSWQREDLTGSARNL